MSQYNIDNINTDERNATPQKPRYIPAILAGLVASVVVAFILAFIGRIFEAEYWYALAFGIAIVGIAIKFFVPSHTVGGALIGAILCPLTYILYQVIMGCWGYYYAEDGEFTFWFMLIGSAILGGWMCYSHDD